MREETSSQELQVELPEEIAEGVYVNLAVVGHSSWEFVLDFIRVMPGMPKASVKSRVILAPEHAKRLLYALKENIYNYEAEMGGIKLREENELLPLGNVKGEA